MVLFFYGADEYRARNHRKRTIEAFKQKRDPEGYNTLIFDVKNTDQAVIFENIQTAPFLAEKKMIVLDNPVSQGDDVLQEKLAEWIEKNGTREDTVLLCFDGTEHEGILFETLKKQQYAQEFAALTHETAAGFCIEEARAHEVVMSGAVCDAIIEGVGLESGALTNVVAQLSLYTKACSRNEVVLDDVGLFVTSSFDDNAFHFVDAVSARDVGNAVHLMQDQWKAEKHPLEVLGTLLWKWRSLCNVKSAMERNDGAKAGDIAKILKMHPFVTEKTMRAVKNISSAQLQEQYKRLLKVDTAIKFGTPPHAAIEAALYSLL